jgi:hypothetical protein
MWSGLAEAAWPKRIVGEQAPYVGGYEVFDWVFLADGSMRAADGSEGRWRMIEHTLLKFWLRHDADGDGVIEAWETNRLYSGSLRDGCFDGEYDEDGDGPPYGGAGADGFWSGCLR